MLGDLKGTLVDHLCMDLDLPYKNFIKVIESSELLSLLYKLIYCCTRNSAEFKIM